MRKVYLAFGVMCEIITFLLGLSFILVGLGLVDVKAKATRFAENLDSLFYKSALLAIGVAVVLVSLRIVFLLMGTLRGRRELTLLKNERGVVKTTAQNLERMLQTHLAQTEGVRAVLRTQIHQRKGQWRLFVTLVPEKGASLEQVRERVNQSVLAFSQRYEPIRFDHVHLDLSFDEESA